jgi:MFS family permease
LSETRPAIPLEQPAPRRRSGLFAPFRYRDYRLLWFGLLVSNLGTWMQLTTLGYLVVQLAGSAAVAALDVGILGASSAIPVLLLSPLAGAVADRFPRRRILLITNSIEVLGAFTLAVLTSTHRLVLWEIVIIAGIRSTGQSFDAPARQSWVSLLVPREYLGNAIGLNSVAFNAPSVIGPPIAGFLILAIGAAYSFYLNSFLTLAVVVVLLFMKPSPPSSTKRENLFASMAAGIRFVARNHALRSIVLLLLAVCLFVRPYQQLMPAYAAHVVHVDAHGLGFMLAAIGGGALCGSIVTATVGSGRRGIVWFAGALLMGIGVIVLGSVRSYGVALAVLPFVGLAVLTFAGNTNVLLQSLSPEDMRGRVVSLFTMVILGGVPAGSLLLGSLASVIGLPASLTAGGIVALGCAVAVWLTSPELHHV